MSKHFRLLALNSQWPTVIIHTGDEAIVGIPTQLRIKMGGYCSCNPNQAHTCKTLGVVTKPKSIASTHAQIHPRNIILTRNRRWAWLRIRKYELACMSREAPRSLVELIFSTTTAYSFVFAVWGRISLY